jgi:hypothetical protein
MYYKTLKGSDTYKNFDKLQQDIMAVTKAAFALVEELGYESYIDKRMACAGGISGIQIAEKPKGWKRVYQKHYDDVYFPSDIKANKELLAKIEALPYVNFTQLNDCVGYKEQTLGTTWMYKIGCSWHDDYVLFTVNDKARFTPPADCTEITVTEYNKLSEKVMVENTEEA